MFLTSFLKEKAPDLYAKSDTLPLYILFSLLLLFPVFLPLGAVLFALWRKSKMDSSAFA